MPSPVVRIIAGEHLLCNIPAELIRELICGPVFFPMPARFSRLDATYSVSVVPASAGRRTDTHVRHRS
jgi:hypothetical protein